MDEPNRVLNPLGFQVTSYRVDNDYAASPPVESEFPTQQVHPDPMAGAMSPVDAAGQSPDPESATPVSAMPAAGADQRAVHANEPASRSANGASAQ